MTTIYNELKDVREIRMSDIKRIAKDNAGKCFENPSDVRLDFKNRKLDYIIMQEPDDAKVDDLGNVCKRDLIGFEYDGKKINNIWIV